MLRNGQRSQGTCRPGIATIPVPGLLCDAVRRFETAIRHASRVKSGAYNAPEAIRLQVTR
jgi:hypothetical protein